MTGRIRPTRLVAWIAVALALLGADRASAHRPWFNLEGSPDAANPYELTEIDVSQVVYAGFARGDRVDYYRLTAPAEFGADVQLVVPAVAQCDDFRPVMVIAGPGLPVDAAIPAGLDLPLADGDGATVVDTAEWGTFFEPFTQTTYATSDRFLSLLDGGEYSIAVFEPNGDAGTYGLALGGSERFGGDPAFLSKIDAINRCDPPPGPAASPEANT